ncbi:hypothetical protein CCAX7_10720 [Capsulimonas corticalis]|uniref:Uncharacterized protein n=1 Tax=Capsulimonas corticalis TaxID=2219043 RepID=A0A402CUM9_9BACT|nr:family 20 glycosylhydrolase [Capsulimonas corticalis]BDI29021.1 hypothetical protein CCAX7_10720 [Capsulimonas corticalis]
MEALENEATAAQTNTPEEVLDERTPEQSYEPTETVASEPWNDLPIRALLLTAPPPEDLDLFCGFIRDALPKEGVNTLVVRFRYQYQFQSHPELADIGALSRDQVRRMLQACRDAGVQLIPKMNLLAHQSDEGYIMPLLAKYPQLDEAPHLNPPVPWKYGGLHDFYTKSLCPQHPDLLPIVFPLMDELIEACEADAFHIGLDEVWILGDDKCPRCGGRDKAELFAEYTTILRNHLAEKGCRTWIWSDRLIDGKTTHLLGWQASMNNTHRAIDMIPKDIVICDWKYEDAPPTPAYFALKGFDVVPSSCYNAEAAIAQLEQVYFARKNGARAFFSAPLANHQRGVFSTSWMSAREFIEAYYGDPTPGAAPSLAENTANTFKALFAEVRRNMP